jgi:hypothetical protein
MASNSATSHGFSPALNGCVKGWKTAKVWHTRPVLKQLTADRPDHDNDFEVSPRVRCVAAMALLEPIEITRHGRHAFVLMSAEQYDRIRVSAGRRAYRTNNATGVVINSGELAEMDASHAALLRTA